MRKGLPDFQQQHLIQVFMTLKDIGARDLTVLGGEGYHCTGVFSIFKNRPGETEKPICSLLVVQAPGGRTVQNYGQKETKTTVSHSPVALPDVCLVAGSGFQAVKDNHTGTMEGAMETAVD